MSGENTLEHQTSFGLNLLANLPIGESQVFSPLSISIGLALVHAGARGKSKEQLEGILLGSPEGFVEHFSKVLDDVTTQAKNGVEVNVASVICSVNDYPIKPEYEQFILDNYKAHLEQRNGQTVEETAGKINGFVESSTQGKIKELVTPDSLKDAIAVIVNAVYIKADWLEKFEKSSTMELGFHKNEGEERQIPFLNDYSTHRDYTENDVFQVLSLPYADTDFSFVIFLPKVRFGLEEALKTFTGTSFQRLLGELTSSYVNIHIPKIHIETSVSLRQNLEKLGITEIFSESADLSGMAPGARISSAVHKSIIEVDEDGTVAAAATAIKARLEMMIMAEPTDFKADHPFLFAVLHKNLPVFLGTHY